MTKPRALADRRLGGVQRAAARLERTERAEQAARENLAAAMLEARAAGATLRQVAAAAGVTLQRVHQIVGNRPPAPPAV